LRALAGEKDLQFEMFGLPVMDLRNPRVDELMYAFCTRASEWKEAHRRAADEVLAKDELR
jgi:hypothetical protein